jgi:mono/diheme cytochrome c family protein
MRSVTRVAALLILVFGVKQALAEGAILSLDLGDTKRTVTAAELLARPDAAEVDVPNDPSFKTPMRYRAVPLLPLLTSVPRGRIDTVEARATDNFVAQVPLSLVDSENHGGATAWIAIEPQDRPWPKLPGKNSGAGPFYLIWTHPERSGVKTEQWVFNLAGLTAAESPAHRWPQLAPDASLPSTSPVRQGERVFEANCLPCHRLNGGGAGDAGPDLGKPMNAVTYFTAPGLRALIRDPKSVRTWPMQQMPGFNAETIPDQDLNALILYLHHIADRNRSAPTK